MDRLILVLIWIFVLFSFITYLLHRFFPKKRYVKYIFLFFLLAGTIYQFYLSRQPGEGFEDLAYFIQSVMSLTGVLAVSITGLILDRFYPRN